MTHYTPPYRMSSPTPRRRRVGLIVSAAVLVVTVAVVAVIVLVVVNRRGAEPDIAACKVAMREQYRTAQADLAAGREPAKSSRPAACKGVDDATLERLVGEILGEQQPR